MLTTPRKQTRLNERCTNQQPRGPVVSNETVKYHWLHKIHSPASRLLPHSPSVCLRYTAGSVPRIRIILAEAQKDQPAANANNATDGIDVFPLCLRVAKRGTNTMKHSAVQQGLEAPFSQTMAVHVSNFKRDCASEGHLPLPHVYVPQ
jgi:hypothetical protein